MKILLAGDTHSNTKWWRTLAKKARQNECDWIVQVGDFGYWEHMDKGVKYLNEVQRYLEEFSLRCVWIDGNHENHPLLWEKYPPRFDGFCEVRPRILYAPRGQRWSWNGVSFLAAGGAYSIDLDHRIPGKSWWATETISDEDVQRCIEGGPVDVVISHDCPWGVDLGSFLPSHRYKDVFPLSRENRLRLYDIVEAVEPKHVIHGHYHYRYSAILELPNGKKVDVLGLASDIEGDARAWTVATLNPEMSRTSPGIPKAGHADASV